MLEPVLRIIILVLAIIGITLAIVWVVCIVVSNILLPVGFKGWEIIKVVFSFKKRRILKKKKELCLLEKRYPSGVHRYCHDRWGVSYYSLNENQISELLSLQEKELAIKEEEGKIAAAEHGTKMNRIKELRKKYPNAFIEFFGKNYKESSLLIGKVQQKIISPVYGY